MRVWSVQEARLFQLTAVRLHAASYDAGVEGIRCCFRELGMVQLDALSVFGRNQDLVLQSRVGGTHPGDFLSLVHRERLGFEYWDKALCAIPIERFASLRPMMAKGGHEWIREREPDLHRDYPGLVEAVYRAVAEAGPVSGLELGARCWVVRGARQGKVEARGLAGALEVLWNRGRLTVSHRLNNRRYFDLVERVIPSGVYGADAPSPREFAEKLLIRRVRSVGLLPTKGDPGTWMLLRRARREGVAERLVEQDRLVLVRVDGVKTLFYAPSDAEDTLGRATRQPVSGRARFIAPLDPLLWARSALKELWGFEYVWEVYKPASSRRFGYYVLPVLHRDQFVGRFDGRYHCKSGVLVVKGFYPEVGGLGVGAPEVRDGFMRFLAYLGGREIRLPDGRVLRLCAAEK